MAYFQCVNQGAESDVVDVTVNGTSVVDPTTKIAEVEVPIKVSDLTNDSGFITSTVSNLTNYYQKSETYTQSEVDALISAIVTLNILVVQTLPTADISRTTIYLVPKSTPDTQDVYDEYINLDGTSSGWEHIGSTQIDLSNYYTKSQVDTLLADKADVADLAEVATSGSYNDLSDKPTIPTQLSQLSTDSTHRVVTDTEKSTWNGKLSDNPTFTEASTRANIASGESFATILGKIKKFFADLKTVAFTGSYNDLNNKPTIPAAQVNSDWNATSGVAQILNKPTIPTVNNATLTIQKNGTTVKTFTANASSNVTANITVPTKVSELSNDSGYTTNTGTVTSVAAGTGLSGGTITSSGTISLANHSADYLSGGYLNIHPENSPTLIPFMNNDIAYLLKRGGSAVVKYDGTTKSVDLTNCFDASPSYWGMNPTDITTIVVELTLHKVFTYTNTIYVDFGATGWRAKNVKIEVMNSNYAQDAWTQKYNNTNNGLGHCYVATSHTPAGASDSGGGFNKVRFTFSSWNSTQFRIAQMGIYNYDSAGLRETFLPKDGGNIYGTIYPNSNNGADLGTSSKYWDNAYITNINGVAVGNSPKFTDTTYSAGTGISLSGTTFSNSGVRDISINGNHLRKNVNGTNTDLTIPFATSSTTASKLGSTTVGSSTRGIYLNAGSPTAVSWYPDYCTISSGNKANYPWHRFATCTTGTGTYVDRDVVVILRSRYNGGAYGAIKLSVHTNGAGTAMSSSATWIYRYGFEVDDVIITSGGTTGTDTTFDAWVKCGTYARRIGYICEGSNNGWSLVDSEEVNNTTATDKKTSTEVFASVSGNVAKDGATVANANTVNNLTVQTAVPANAKFTDTTYTAGSNITLSGTKFSLTKANVTGALGYTPPTTDTKNTAGSTDTSSKIFLIGATSQAANPQTYSDNEVYTTSGVLTAKKLSTTNLGLNGGALNLATSGSSSNDSADIVFYYGNGSEKARIWTDNSYVAGTLAGPNYSVNTNPSSSPAGQLQTKLATLVDLSYYLPLTGGNLTNNLTIKSGKILYLSQPDNTKSSSLSTSSNGTLSIHAVSWMNLCTPQQVQCRNANDTAWVNIAAANISSSRRFKENIQDLTEEEARKLLDVRTVTFDFKEEYAPSSDWEHERFHQQGVIAEEVKDIFPTLVRYSNYENPDEEPIPTFVEYSHFVPYLIKMIQMQQKEIDDLKVQIDDLNRRIK